MSLFDTINAMKGLGSNLGDMGPMMETMTNMVRDMPTLMQNFAEWQRLMLHRLEAIELNTQSIIATLTAMEERETNHHIVTNEEFDAMPTVEIGETNA